MVSIVGIEGGLFKTLAATLDGSEEKPVVRGDRVLIKPNLVEPADPESGQITTPGLVEAVARYCLECGAAEVVVGEGPGYYQPASYLRQCFTATGISVVTRRLGIKWVLFDDHAYRTFPGVPGCIPREFRITEFALSCNKIINLPVLKTHWLTKVTLAMKNLKGCLKREDKPIFHREDLPRAIVELCQIVRPTLNIIDCTPRAIARQLGPGRSHFKGAGAGLLVISPDIVAVDAVGSALMGIDPASVATIGLGAASGLGEGSLMRIDVIGSELKRLKFKPELAREKLKQSFPFLEIIGARKACSGCLIPLLRALNILREQDFKYQRPVKIYIGDKPGGWEGQEHLFVGDCARIEDDDTITWVRGCPPNRDEILSHLLSLFTTSG